MAETITLVSELPSPVTAGADLRAHQFKFVQVTQAGVMLADARSFGITKAYVLVTQSNSGQSCGLSSDPNVARVMVASACIPGQWVRPYSATGLAEVTSAGDAGHAGVAWSTCTGSGQFASVHLAT